MCICAIVENKQQRTLKCNILVHCSAVCRLALAVSPMQCKVQCVLKCDVYNVHKESSIKEFAFNMKRPLADDTYIYLVFLKK